MSEQNVEIVRSILEPFGSMNVAAIDWSAEEIREAIGPAYSPDFELRTLASGVGTGLDDVYSGVDGLVRYLRDWLQPFSEYHLELQEYIEAGDCVLVPSRQWGVGSTSGARVEIDVTLLYELQDGKIARMAQYDTLEEAHEAARQRE
jgi:ketosteroid isomerase-like protein